MDTTRIGKIIDLKVKAALEALDESTFPRELDPAQDGVTTCLMHRQWEWTIANYTPLLGHCDLCGGKVDPRLLRHHLCAARRKLNPEIALPRLDCIPACACKRCADRRTK